MYGCVLFRSDKSLQCIQDNIDKLSTLDIVFALRAVSRTYSKCISRNKPDKDPNLQNLMIISPVNLINPVEQQTIEDSTSQALFGGKSEKILEIVRHLLDGVKRSAIGLNKTGTLSILHSMSLMHDMKNEKDMLELLTFQLLRNITDLKQTELTFVSSALTHLNYDS